MGVLEKIIVFGILIALVIFITGYWLHKAGKPYSTLILTLHKLIAFGLFVCIVIVVYQMNKAESLSSVELIIFWSVFAGFIIAIASGGVLSTDRQLPVYVRHIHNGASFLSGLCASVLLYLLRARV